MFLVSSLLLHEALRSLHLAVVFLFRLSQMIYSRNVPPAFGKRLLFVLKVLRPVSSRICFHILEGYKLEIGVEEESCFLL